MLKRQNLPPAEQAAAVIDEMIVERFEHIDIDIRKGKRLQFRQPFQCFIVINAFAVRNQITFCPAFLLRFLIAEVVCITDLGKVIHIFRAEL